MVSLIATSVNGSARFGIGAGWYEILVKIGDVLGAITDFISAGFVHGDGLPSNVSASMRVVLLALHLSVARNNCSLQGKFSIMFLDFRRHGKWRRQVIDR